MSHSTTYAGRSQAAVAADGLIAKVRKALADYRLYSATVQELQQLSDRELADLGIHRTAITSIARETVYRA